MRRPGKAFLLAAGLGTRLKPLTDKTPKCLLPLGGRPLLYWWLKIARDLGVREALVNTHHLAGQVEAFAAAWRGEPRLRLSHEPELLGSAGTIAANAEFVAGQEAFWIFYADTLVTADLSPLWELHAAREPMLTVGLFRPPDPKACGVVELSGEGRVLSFEEKPARPKSDLAAVGVYIAGPGLLPRLPLPGDLGKDVLPGLEANVYGKLLDGPAIDIGTPAAYERARSRWKELGLAPGGETMSYTKEYFGRLSQALAEMPEGSIDTLFAWMRQAYEAERQIFVMGNGGSAATASHFVCDINKGVSMNLKKKFRMIAVNDNQPTLTAYANDVSYDEAFARTLENFLRPGDLVLGISTSGNSKNVIRAFELAKSRGHKTLALLGRPGGKLQKLADASVVVPTEDVQLAEDLHHSLCHMLMRRFCRELGVEPAGKPLE